MIPEIRNHSNHQRIKDLGAISPFLHTWIDSLLPVKDWGLFDYDLNDITRNNGAKLISKHFSTSVAQHFDPIKITTTWNALPNEVVSRITVNTFKNSLDKHLAQNPVNVRLTGSNHRCRAQFKCAPTVVGQGFVGNGPNGLSYYYYILLLLLLVVTSSQVFFFVGSQNRANLISLIKLCLEKP